MADNFNVFIGKPKRRWYKRDERCYDGWNYGATYTEGDAPQKVAGPYQEPAEAADMAELALKKMGVPGQSYAELRFNGDPEPHTIIFMLEHDLFGVWNTGSVKWPIYYPEGNPYGSMLDGWPDGFDDGTPEDENSDGFGDTDEDSKLMDLGNDGTDEEDENTDEEDDEDSDGEEEPEEDEGTDEEDDSDESGDDEMDSEDKDADEEDESEDEPDDDEDGTESDKDSTDESEDENGDEEAESETQEEETELPRLKLFAKMRGPLGWRKRAEIEELQERNTWALKVGVLDPDEDLTAAKREQNVFVNVEFIEQNADHAKGVLRMRLPDGIEPSSFNVTKAGWITVEIPMPHEADA